MIRYPEFRCRGGQIGSGPTESECNTTTQRGKGRGRRWDGGHAKALMALASLDNSRVWQTYWTTLNPERNQRCRKYGRTPELPDIDVCAGHS